MKTYYIIKVAAYDPLKSFFAFANPAEALNFIASCDQYGRPAFDNLKIRQHTPESLKSKYGPFVTIEE